MESKAKGALSRCAQHLMLFTHGALVFSVCFCGRTPCCSQEPETGSLRTSTKADHRFETPQSATAQWVRAVNKHDWREEYVCYTGMQQAKFTYQLMVSTRELSDSEDLAAELSRILQRHSFASTLLDSFPSTRLDLSDLHDPVLEQSVVEVQHRKRQEQIARWEREIQPLDMDWAGMIGDLQPLFVQSYQRHRNDLHPSNGGIAFHLDFHSFQGSSNFEIVGDHATGLVIPIVSDPAIVVDEAEVPSEANGFGKVTALFERGIQKLPFAQRRARRSPAKIGLVRGIDGWKIHSVPFR